MTVTSKVDFKRGNNVTDCMFGFVSLMRLYGAALLAGTRNERCKMLAYVLEKSYNLHVVIFRNMRVSRKKTKNSTHT